MPVAHTGRAMARILSEVLDRFQLTSRLHCTTTDNAAPNLVMQMELGEILNYSVDFGETWWDLGPESMRIPCMAHVIQLVVKAMLQHLDLQTGEEVVDDNDNIDDSLIENNLPESIGSVVLKVRSMYTVTLESNANLFKIK